MTFESKQALEGYGPHATHQALIKDFITPVKQDIVIVDFEV